MYNLTSIFSWSAGTHSICENNPSIISTFCIRAQRSVYRGHAINNATPPFPSYRYLLGADKGTFNFKYCYSYLWKIRTVWIVDIIVACDLMRLLRVLLSTRCILESIITNFFTRIIPIYLAVVMQRLEENNVVKIKF